MRLAADWPSRAARPSGTDLRDRGRRFLSLPRPVAVVLAATVSTPLVAVLAGAAGVAGRARLEPAARRRVAASAG